MKKFLLLLMTISISVFLVACFGGDDKDAEDTEDTEDTEENEDTEDTEKTEDKESDADSKSTDEEASDKESDEDSEDSESKEESDEESADSSTEEIETAEAVDGNKLDVLSATFGDEFFGGPEAYDYNSIPEGSTQEDVEELYGTHELLFDSNGTELAVYGNLAVEYSGGSAYFEGNDAADVASAAENTVENVYMYAGVTVQEFSERYGVPTRQYDQFIPEEGQTAFFIYDWTRDNDFAVYGEVISVHRSAEGEEVALEAPIVSVVYKDVELDALPEAVY